MEREWIIEALKICDSNYDGVVCKKCPIKDEDYNGSWCDKDGDCYQHLMREAAELLSVQSTIQSQSTAQSTNLIDRQATIDAVNNAFDRETLLTGFVRSIAVRAIRDMPSVQPERKKGEWLPDNNNAYEMRFECSCCKESEVVPTIGFTKYKPLWDFCPNCGADMRGEKDG